MNSLELKETLISYFKSAIPIIIIDTVEVERATKEVINTVNEFNNKIFRKMKPDEFLSVHLWNIRDGWRQDENSKGENNSLDTALDYIGRFPNTIYILQNFHFAWQDNLSFPFVLQGFRKAYDICRSDYCHVICIGSAEKIPPELTPYVKVIELSLPCQEERKKIIENYLNESGMSVTVNTDIVEASAGMVETDIIHAVNLSLTKNKGKKLDRQTIFDCKIDVVKKTQLLEFIPSQETIDDIGGCDNLKSWLKLIAKAFLERDKAEQYKLPVPKGCLVAGISGTGKTLGAKALSSLFKIPLFRCDVGRVFGKFVGETEKNSRELFKLIDSVSPAIILFDEVEKILAGLGSSDRSDSGVTARFIGSILYYMQEKKTASFFYFTANDVTSLPPELMRKGRLDELWFLDLPTEKERKEIFKIHVSKVGRNPDDYDINKLAKISINLSGAEIENVIKSAMYVAFNEDREFTTDDIKNAIEITPILAKTKELEINTLRAWAKGRARIANSIITDSKRKMHWAEE